VAWKWVSPLFFFLFFPDLARVPLFWKPRFPPHGVGGVRRSFRFIEFPPISFFSFFFPKAFLEHGGFVLLLPLFCFGNGRDRGGFFLGPFFRTQNPVFFCGFPPPTITALSSVVHGGFPRVLAFRIAVRFFSFPPVPCLGFFVPCFRVAPRWFFFVGRVSANPFLKIPLLVADRPSSSLFFLENPPFIFPDWWQLLAWILSTATQGPFRGHKRLGSYSFPL